tara:strand:- start:23789 stop:24493 length:705 start_codon:yes stop_codon:yes gene_type:complete
MKYNILTVLNEGYAHFGKLFINSLFENIDLYNIENIIVYDTGLSANTRSYLEYFPKVLIVETGENYNSEAIHDEGWKNNTYSKTKYLLSSLEETGVPTLMIDSDCIFVEGFDHLLDWDSDIVVCSRDRQGFSQHIGSFFGALNVASAKVFVDKWISNVTLLQTTSDLKHCESPALSKTLLEETHRAQQLPEQVVSAVFPDSTSCIYHLKSDYYAVTIEERLGLAHAAPFVQRYL